MVRFIKFLSIFFLALVSGLNGAEHQSYSVVSWNVGTLRDYAALCFLRDWCAEGYELGDAFESLPRYPASVPLSEEDKKARVDLFQQALLHMGNPDIICLQETWEMSDAYLQTILPPGYAFFSYRNGAGKGDGSIAWRSDCFSCVHPVAVSYRSLDRAPDTILLLQDHEGRRLCICSAHLQGFSLSHIAHPQEQKGALAGDQQAKDELEVMNAESALVYVYAGDFNAAPELYSPRFTVLQDEGYVTFCPHPPTIYDVNLKEADQKTPSAVALDYIYAKGGEGILVCVQSQTIDGFSLNHLIRPSDHLPIAARVFVHPR